MKLQIKMLSNIVAVAGVSLLMVMALLPAGLTGAEVIDSSVSDSDGGDTGGTTPDPSLGASDPTDTSDSATQPPHIEVITGGTDTETTTEPEEVGTTSTTAKTTAVTTTTTAPPQTTWTEQTASGIMYVNTDGIYSRYIPIIGTASQRVYSLNETVTVVALTDTGYYKLEDGTFIHSDYLSASPIEVTEAETTQPPETAPPEIEPPETEPDEETSDTDDEVPLYSEPEAQGMALEMFRLVNEYRAQYGLPALQWDYTAGQAAQIRAKELLSYNSHTRPNGTRYHTVYDELGYAPGYTGENIVYYYNTARSALNSLINSSAHRDLIFSSRYTHIGIAYVYDPNSYWGYYWVQEFTSP